MPWPPAEAIPYDGKNDTGGCALSIVYESDVNKVQPEDFVVFSIQQICVWYRFSHFDVPAHMPHCPHGKCICQWTWQHRADSGTEQRGTSPKRLAKPKVPRLCGGDPDRHIPPNPKDCVSGAKQPFYWLQLERNNMPNPSTIHPSITIGIISSKAHKMTSLRMAHRCSFPRRTPRRRARRSPCLLRLLGLQPRRRRVDRDTLRLPPLNTLQLLTGTYPLLCLSLAWRNDLAFFH
ncbi:uncharacterized protein EI90DRAFT_2668495 [Cantharellus anzutake]|uniref:uncharacterized protein n=1 Tax=Cantharellus anzutake TaxID=1750568 RepID=UPI001904C529|nr:uncharacterized protein EI90DRAFT_2668495 [Cantharellus anzutake]KAF8337590.1 hypothetical protein EI90DRAFT_2668495 [Cantharellus anzutake]